MDETIILNSSQKYAFSKDLIIRYFQRYGKRTLNLVESLRRPGSYQALRVNTLKTSPKQLIQALAAFSPNITSHPKIEESLLLKIHGPSVIDRHPKTIVVKKQAAENILLGTNLYTPGVLRAGKIKPGDQISIVDLKNNHVANGIAKMNAKDMLEKKKGLAAQVQESIYEVMKLRELELFERGHFYSQSLPAIIASKNLDPQENELILDLCAAPGGKTTHLGQLMKNTGKIIAIDRTKSRLARLKASSERLGINNVEIFTNKDIENLKKDYLGCFDKVMVDPPCSSTGVRPKLYDITTEKEILDCARYQKHFLHLANEFLKPGGIMIYSTCSMEPEENELNIKYGVDELGLKIVKQDFFLGSIGERTENLDYQKLQRFYPDLHDLPGYFIAKLKKN